ncbi:MAG: hypothetical protein JSV78_11905 [Phycisphaerales bacterium]|nr:MAG: hypothetical protein JSV78_11905 [Phycisphaerales bacterium]
MKPNSGSRSTRKAAHTVALPYPREAVRADAKLAFVALEITTLFAAEASAAGNNHSCHPAGHPWQDEGSGERCCAGP